MDSIADNHTNYQLTENEPNTAIYTHSPNERIHHRVHRLGEKPKVKEANPKFDIDKDKDRWRKQSYDAMVEYGISAKKAAAFRDCSAEHATFTLKEPQTINSDLKGSSVYVCASDPSHDAKVVRYTCHLPACPDCARRASHRFQSRFVPFCTDLSKRNSQYLQLRRITLTTDVDLRDPDCYEKMQWYYNKVPKWFDETVGRNKKGKRISWRKTQGYFSAAEFGENGYKLHFHIIAYCSFISNKRNPVTKENPNGDSDASLAWQKVTGGKARVVDIRGIKDDNVEKDVIEAIKYATKLWKIDKITGDIIRIDAQLMPILMEVLTKFRRVRTAGIFYKLPEPEKDPACCEQCGSFLQKWTISQWNTFVYWEVTPDEVDSYFSSESGNKSPPTSPKNMLPKPSLIDFYEQLPLWIDDKAKKSKHNPYNGEGQ